MNHFEEEANYLKEVLDSGECRNYPSSNVPTLCIRTDVTTTTPISTSTGTTSSTIGTIGTTSITTSTTSIITSTTSTPSTTTSRPDECPRDPLNFLWLLIQFWDIPIILFVVLLRVCRCRCFRSNVFVWLCFVTFVLMLINRLYVFFWFFTLRISVYLNS